MLALTCLPVAVLLPAEASGGVHGMVFWLETAVVGVLGLGCIWLLGRAVDWLGRHQRVAGLPLRTVRTLLRWIGGAVLVSLLLERFGISAMTTLGTLLAMVAVGVVAVWSLLSHITATLLILFTRPFRMGDRVLVVGEQVGDVPVEGVVVDINFFHTTLETADGESFRVPNNFFFQKIARVRRGLRPPQRTLAEALAVPREDQMDAAVDAHAGSTCAKTVSSPPPTCIP